MEDIALHVSPHITYLYDNKGTLRKQGESPLPKERCWHLFVDRFHQRHHPPFDVSLSLDPFFFGFKQLMGKVDRRQHCQLRWGRRLHPFRQMSHMIVDEMGQPPDIGIIAVSCDRVPLTINFYINGLSQGPPPWDPRHIRAAPFHS